MIYGRPVGKNGGGMPSAYKDERTVTATEGIAKEDAVVVYQSPTGLGETIYAAPVDVPYVGMTALYANRPRQVSAGTNGLLLTKYTDYLFLENEDGFSVYSGSPAHASTSSYLAISKDGMLLSSLESSYTDGSGTSHNHSAVFKDEGNGFTRLGATFETSYAPLSGAFTADGRYLHYTGFYNPNYNSYALRIYLYSYNGSAWVSNASLYDAATYKFTAGGTACIEVSPVAGRFAMTHCNQYVRFGSFTTSSITLSTVANAGGTVYDIRYSKDGAYLYAGIAGGVKVFHAETGALVQSVGSGDVKSLSLSPDGSRLVVSSSVSPFFYLYEADQTTGQLTELTIPTYFSAQPAGVGFSASGSNIFTVHGQAAGQSTSYLYIPVDTAVKADKLDSTNLLMRANSEYVGYGVALEDGAAGGPVKVNLLKQFNDQIGSRI